MLRLNRTSSWRFLCAAVLAVLVLIAAPAAQAQFRIFVVDTANNLSSFSSADPTTLVSGPTAITGLQAGEVIRGMDFRPADGLLYAVGTNGAAGDRLYTINTTTGVATQVGADGVFVVGGSFPGVDFNPVVDQLRVVSDFNDNFRVNPNDGTLAGTDTDTAYDAGDANAGTTPIITGVAYTNNFAGATTTTLFAIDVGLNVLVRQGSVDGTPTSPNSGLLFTIGPLGLSFINTSLDIAPDGTAFATDANSLYTINLATGAATLVGAMGFTIDAMAVAPSGVCSGAPAGIISWWPGEGNAQDIVSQHDGTLQNGATFGTGTVGQAFSLDGIDDAILVDNNAALNPASITVEAWVNPNSVPAGAIAPVVTKWGFDATIDSYYLALLESGGVVRVLGAIGDGASGDPGFSGGTVALNTWNHIAMTYDAASGQNVLYLNGVSVSQRVRANGIFPTTSRVFIGREDSNNNRFFSGLIDEPTIYSRALTDAEILAIFNAGGNGKCGASPTGADLSVTKTDSPDPVLVSTNITYTVTVRNNGPDPATGIVLTDTLDAAVTYVSDTGGCNTAALPVITCALADLASGASAIVTVVVAAPAVAGTVTNTADVTAAEADANLTNNTASASTTVNTVQADVSITKTDSPDPQGVGGNITYTVTVSNAGPDPATNVALTDTLSGAATTFVSVTSAGNTCNSAGFPAITCTMGTIASGTSETVTIVVTATAAGTVTNTASSTATEPDPNTANNTNIAQNTAVQAAGFTLAVTPGTVTILPGQAATFTVTVTPTPFVATVDLTGSGTPPLGSLTFGSTTLNPGNTVASTTMVVGTDGFFVVQRRLPQHSAPTYAYWLPVTGFGVAGLLLMGRDRKRIRGNRRAAFVALLSLLILASLIAGCAFGRNRDDEGTPGGTYPITVTATGGGVTQTATVNVVVQGTN